jgi:hypothetical protein
MKTTTIAILFVSLGVSLIAGPAVRAFAFQDETPAPAAAATHAAPVDPNVPAAPNALLWARPFVSEKPIEFVVNGEKKLLTKGLILVLDVDKKLVEPLDVPDYVVYVGDAVAQKINSGYVSGKLVVMAPEVDLATAPIWFGSRAVTERLTPSDVSKEKARAAEKAIRPRSEAELRAARRAAGAGRFDVKNMDELWFETGPTILRFAPDERDMVMSLRKS